MKDMSKTKKQLIEEMDQLRQRVVELETYEIEREEFDRSLRETHEKLRAMFESTTDTIIVTDLEGTILEANEAATEMTEYPAEILIGMNAFELISPEYIDSATEVIGQTYQKNRTGYNEVKFLTANGETRDAEYQTTLLNDSHNNPAGFITITRDITERKRAAERLRQREEKLRIVFDSIGDAITIIDTDGTITEVNEASARFSGFGREEIIGRSGLEFVCERDREKVANDILNKFKNRDQALLEYSLLAKDGKEYAGEVNATLLRDEYNRPVELITVLRDITWRKQMEEQLRESEERLRALFDNAPDAIFTNTLEGTLLDGNRAAEELLGYTKKELVGKSFFEAGILPDEYLNLALQKLEESKKGILTKPVEFELIRKDGSRVTVEIMSITISTEGKGEIMGIARDVTDRRQMEEALQESERNYRVLFERAIEGIVVIDVETMRVVLCNQSAARQYGFEKAEDIIGLYSLDWVHQDDREKVMTSIAEDMFERNLQSVLEIRTITRGGEEKWVSVTSTTTEYQGKLAGLISFRDVTERKKAEDALRNSEEKLRATFESVRDGIIVVDLEGKVLQVNDAATSITGYTTDELIGKNALDFTYGEDRGKVIEDMARTLENVSIIPVTSYRLVNTDGDVIDVESRNSVIRDSAGNPAGFVGILRDVTESRKAEEALRQSEEKYRSLVENINDVVFSLDQVGYFTYVSPSIEKVAGYKPEEITGEHFNRFIHPEDFAEAFSSFERFGQGDIGPLEFRGVGKTGTIHYMRVSPQYLWEGDQLMGVTGVMSDVTEMKLTEMALRESQEKLRGMFESMHDGVTVADLEGKIVDVNEAAVRIAGFDRREEAIWVNGLEFIAEKDRGRALEDMAKAFEEGRVATIEYEMLNRKGQRFDLEIAANLMHDSSGNPTGFISVLRDVTERKQAEEQIRRAHAQLQEAMEQLKASQEQLLQSEKLAAVGQLVSGVAHELNNPLMAIHGYAELMLRNVHDEPTRSDLEHLKHDADRAIAIVRNLLSFARKQESKKVPVSINDVIDSIVNLRFYELSLDNITVETRLSPDLPDILANFQQLQQVFLNLLLNSEHAIKSSAGKGHVLIETVRNDNNILAYFSDDGPGIPAQMRGRVFEPFFTTKDVGEGTGLGLSICYGIIQDHEGEIFVESTGGSGTTFKIELPIADA
ncbi:MAG: PAS domain S-box protein [Dehalococcoidia bacterium]